MTTTTTWTIEVGGETTTAAYDPAPNGDRATIFVCAHGAGGNMADRGVLTVARIHRPAGLDYATWIERWHGTQSPESARLQPRTRYVRNEVVRAVTASAPEADGIVEEAWPSVAHVADPMLFFNADGDPQRCRDHIAEMLANVEACLDLARLRSTTMSEHLVRVLG